MQHVYRAKFMLTVAYNGNLVTADISIDEIRNQYLSVIGFESKC